MKLHDYIPGPALVMPFYFLAALWLIIWSLSLLYLVCIWKGEM